MDTNEKPFPDMHLIWDDGTETLINHLGEVVIGRHHGKNTVAVPRKHQQAADNLIDRFLKNIGNAPCQAADANLGALLGQTILDETDVLPPPLFDSNGVPFPAQPHLLSPDGIEPDESLDLLLLGLVTELLAPEVALGPETVGPPPVELPVPDPRQIPVPAF